MKKKIGAFGAGQFSLGTLVEGQPGTTIFQNPRGGWGGSHTRTRPGCPPRLLVLFLNNFGCRRGMRWVPYAPKPTHMMKQSCFLAFCLVNRLCQTCLGGHNGLRSPPPEKKVSTLASLDSLERHAPLLVKEYQWATCTTFPFAPFSRGLPEVTARHTQPCTPAPIPTAFSLDFSDRFSPPFRRISQKLPNCHPLPNFAHFRIAQTSGGDSGSSC